MMTKDEMDRIRDNSPEESAFINAHAKASKKKGDFVDDAHEGRNPYSFYRIVRKSYETFQTEAACVYSSIETAVIATVISRNPALLADIIETITNEDERTDVASLRFYILTDGFAGSIRAALASCRLVDKDENWLKRVAWSEIIATTLGHQLEQSQNTLAARLRLR